MQQHHKTLTATSIGIQEAQSPLAQAVGEANAKLDMAFAHLSNLKERLAPALLPERPISEGESSLCPKAVTSPAVAAVEELSARIVHLVNSLADTNDRVGV